MQPAGTGVSPSLLNFGRIVPSAGPNAIRCWIPGFAAANHESIKDTKHTKKTVRN